MTRTSAPTAPDCQGGAIGEIVADAAAHDEGGQIGQTQKRQQHAEGQEKLTLDAAAEQADGGQCGAGDAKEGHRQLAIPFFVLMAQEGQQKQQRQHHTEEAFEELIARLMRVGHRGQQDADGEDEVAERHVKAAKLHVSVQRGVQEQAGETDAEKKRGPGRPDGREASAAAQRQR